MKTEIEMWLEQVQDLQELILAKKAEYEISFELATDTGSKAPDGMPYSNTGTVSRKIENNGVDMALISSEIDIVTEKYTAHKNAVIAAIEQLPLKEYKVLHRFYIRNMTLEEIAEELNYSRSQIWRIKKSGLKNLEKIVKI